ncbi:MAG: hypothetical protein ACO3VQ_02580, partial [Ilumatobacteraceae bacterium]
MGGIVRRLTRRTLQRASRTVYLCLLLWAWFAPTSVTAASFTVTAESDWYFTVEQDQTLVVIYGNSNADCENVTADPYLWLYDDNPESTGQLIAADDDGNHNWTDQCVSSK